MMWQPTASAWNTLSSSRGLAQISSAFGFAFMICTDFCMIGIGSTPVSAMRPANTEMIAGVFASSRAVMRSTWSSVMTAVTLRATPAFDKRSITAPANSRFVLVTGILTLTFLPQEAISRACTSISPKSSAKTSNETGRSGIAASTSRAKAL